MIDFAAELNPAQQKAATASDGPVLVIAGAGSGKTRTLVYRLAYLVKQGIDPRCLLLLTFTRKAAAEMLDRARAVLEAHGMHTMHDATGGTFHSFAYSMLRKFPGYAGLHSSLSIIDQPDAQSILKDLRQQLDIAKGDRSFPKNSTVLALISKSRNKELSLEQILQDEAIHLLHHETELTTLAKAYAAYKQQYGLLDYDDLLFSLEHLLTEHEPARQFAHSQYTHIMVDEYQDTNLVQARLVALLAGTAGNVMAVGDDAQSIYAFRGATVDNILSFPRQFSGTQLVRLEQNYRSTQPILDLSNALLDQAERRFKKNLFTTRETGSLPQLIRTVSDNSQAALVLTKIMELSTTYPLGEIAVLFRAGFHSYMLELALNKAGIAFCKYGGMKFSEAAHIKDILSYLRLLVNPADVPAWQRVMQAVKGVGPKTAQRLCTAVLSGDTQGIEKATKRFPAIKELLDFIDSLRNRALSPPLLLNELLIYYQPVLEKTYPDDYPRRQAGLEQLTRIAARYTSLEEFLADICLETPETQQQAPSEQTLVLSTVHSAKGLEWSAVLILDLVEERFPSRHALASAEEMEEERRLLYVAITRAKDKLLLFAPDSLYNQHKHISESTIISPFLAGLPQHTFEAWQQNFSGTLRRADDPDQHRSLCSTVLPEPVSGALVDDRDETPEDFPEDFPDSFPDTFPDMVTKHPPSDTASASPPVPPHIPPHKLGYCHHKIFGRGKIIAAPDQEKYRVHFPGFGIKTILARFLRLE